MFKRTRYQYTCPDVIHYRRNQYRLAIWSNVFSVVYIAGFWVVLTSIFSSSTETETPEPEIAPAE